MPETTQFNAHRATRWQLKTRTLDCGRLPLLMGIVNVTPDSFSDGGDFFRTEAAIQHALELVAEGADLLDIGGESTRPYAEPVGTQEELDRVLPVVEALTRQTDVPMSIDTFKAAVARAAVGAGAEVINDVTGLAGDPVMLATAAELSVGVCAMHMQGTPQTMQDDPQYNDVVTDIAGYLAERRDALIAAGIVRERICLDPGIGFGKTHQHNLQLVARVREFHSLGCPVLVGHSRKGFLTKLVGKNPSDRTLATVGASIALATQGVQVLRIHDVAAVRKALLAFDGCGGIDGQPATLAE